MINTASMKRQRLGEKIRDANILGNLSADKNSLKFDLQKPLGVNTHFVGHGRLVLSGGMLGT